jgi:opacity protein-like surface antigen
MKNIKTLIAALCIIMCFALPANAQNTQLKLDLNYNYSIPLSGFKKDLISNGSPRGFIGDLMYTFNTKLSAGLEFGFQDYYQKYPRTLYNLSKTQQISAVLTNSIQTTPLLLKAKYFPQSNSFLKPYVSLGAGANVIDFKQYYGEFGNSQTNIGFRAQAGIGVKIPFKKTSASGINVGATYDYAPYNKNGYKDLSSANIQAGVVIQLK